MVLTAANLFHYLLDRGFATAESVVDGDFRVSDFSRRNRAFQVSFEKRPGYVVKQVKKWRASNVETFEAEADWYWRARNEATFEPIAGFLSKCCGYDAENQVLILELPPECEDLDRYHSRAGRFPIETARLLGETLASFHTALPDSTRNHVRESFPCRVPWAFSLHRTSEQSLESVSKANTELLKITQKYAGFGEALDQLIEGWHPATLINGDMKFAHCILDGPRLYFVDWEMADFGDPYWDVGAIFQEYLHAWIRSMRAAPDLSLEEAVAGARCPLTELQPAIRAFWESYTSRTPAAGDPLRRTVNYTAVRMMQTAYQALQEADELSSRALRLLQLSLNILTKPAEATDGLLGL